MENENQSHESESRIIYEFGRPYFIPFFIILLIALFGELQVAMATIDMPTNLTGSLLFSHFGLFLSLSLLTMAGVKWAVRSGLSDNQRRLALAALTLALIMLFLFWPTAAEPLAPVFRIPLDSAQGSAFEFASGLLDGAAPAQ